MSLPDSSIVVPGYSVPVTPLPVYEWDLADSIPAKSRIMDYGYIIKDRAIGCFRQELIETVAQRRSEISFVWTPETPQPVRPELVPFLIASFRRMEMKQARNYLWLGAALMAVGVVLPFVIGGWEVLRENYIVIFGGIVLAAGNWKFWRSRGYTQDDAVSDASAARFNTWISKRRSLSSYAITLIACIVVVSAFQGLAGDSVGRAGLVKPAVWRGEVWRLFTAPLMHTSFNHFLMIALALGYVSKVVEQTIHRAFLPLLFLISAAVGSVFSVVLYPQTTSVGASGGIMGLLSFIAIAAYLDRTKYPPRYFKRMIGAMLLIVAFGFFGFEFMDNGAHVGGMVAGLMMGLVCVAQKRGQTTGKLLRLAGVAGVSVMIFTAVFAILRISGG